MSITAIIEARMTSKRLPGKVLLRACNKPLLELLVNRVMAAPSITKIVIATTCNEADDQIEELCKRLDIICFRGSENDVLIRVIEAGDYAKADIIVGITGDCPIIDPQIIEQSIRIFKANKVDFLTTGHVRSYPDGMDVRVLNLKTLKRSALMTNDPLDREHVTLHIRNHPELFKHLYLIAPPEITWPELGLTLDEPEDYELLKKIIEFFYPTNPLFSCLDVVRLLSNNPDWVNINKNVRRKGDN